MLGERWRHRIDAIFSADRCLFGLVHVRVATQLLATCFLVVHSVTIFNVLVDVYERSPYYDWPTFGVFLVFAIVCSFFVGVFARRPMLYEPFMVYLIYVIAISVPYLILFSMRISFIGALPVFQPVGINSAHSSANCSSLSPLNFFMFAFLLWSCEITGV